MRRILIFLVLVLLLVSCDGSVGDLIMDSSLQIRTHVVTFIGWENTFEFSVVHGHTVSPPDVPQREDYVFIGWFEDDIPFDFQKPITEDITLEAGWEEEPTRYGSLTINAVLDSEALDDVLIKLSGKLNYLGTMNDGSFIFHNLPTGRYSVLVDEADCGSVTIREGENTLDLEFFSVTIVPDAGVASSVPGGYYLEGTELDLSAEAKEGWDILEWKSDGNVVIEGKSGRYTVQSTAVLTIESGLHKWVLGFSGDEVFAEKGRIGSGSYVLGPTEQWLEVVWPTVHGKNMVSYEIDDAEHIRMESGFLVLSPGHLGDVYINTVWEDAGSSVTVNVVKDGVSWTDTDKSLSLRSDREFYDFTEATKNGCNITWPIVSYGTYRIYDGNTDLGISLEVGEQSVSTSVYYYSVTLTKDGGIESVSGEGVYPEGQMVTISAVASDGYEFVSWKAGSANHETRLYSFNIYSKTSMKALSKESVEEIRPLPGVIIQAYDVYNGANYKFYDADMKRVDKDHLTEAVFYSVGGIPESPAYLVCDMEYDDGHWGYYGKKIGALSNLGKVNTYVVQSGEVEESSMWADLQQGWFIAGKTECNALFNTFPDLTVVPVWSSTEDSKYSSWLHTENGWIIAGKNTVARVFPMTTI